MSESLYSSCAQVLSLCQAAKDDLAALLDPNTGFAPRLRQLCHDQWVSTLVSGTRLTSHQNLRNGEQRVFGYLPGGARRLALGGKYLGSSTSCNAVSELDLTLHFISRRLQRTQNRAKTSRPSAHAARPKSIHTDVNASTSNHAIVGSPHRTRRSTRMAPRNCIPTTTSRSHHWLLEVYET